MVTVSINGTRRDIPCCYEELTAHQFERIVQEWDYEKELADRDFLQLFNILADTDFKGAVGTSDNEVTVWNAVKWFVDPYYFSKEVPKVLVMGDRIIDVPTKLRALTIGQNIHMRQEAEKSKCLMSSEGIVLEYSCYSMAVAIYMQPIIDGVAFDMERARILKDKIGQMPIHIIRPLGFFLLVHVWKYGKTSESKWRQTQNNLMQRMLRMFPLWQKVEGSLRSLT